MAFCSYSRDAAMFDATPIDNMFLLEYMPDAPEGFVRVYLYARMLCQHPELGGEIADVAKALHMEEDAVLNAMSYWEQQGLAEKLSDRPASYSMPPLRGGAAARAQADQDYYKYRKFNSSLQALFGENELLEPRQYRMANDWLTLLGFSEEAALKLVEYELRQPGGRRSASVFKRADKRALDWAERGIHSVEDVERAISYDQRVYEMASLVLRQLSIGRKPTVNELNDVRRWIEDWKLSREDVLAACAETTKSRAPSIAYLDAILKSRVERGGERFDALKEALRELNPAAPTPTPEQARAYGEFLSRGFEPETVRLAAVQCARKNKHQFADLEWMLNSWGDAGVRRRDEAERYISDMQRRSEEMGAALKAAGIERRPNMGDLERYETWRAAHSPELILCAAELARSARSPLLYMDKLLSNWARAGITTPEAARAEGARRAQDAAASQGSAAPARNYQQHEYSAADFSEDFYYDPSKDYPEGGEGK